MKRLFVTAVAVFLLYSVLAEKTGPANVLTTPRRFKGSLDVRTGHSVDGLTVDAKYQNPLKPRRPWIRDSKVTSVSGSPKTNHGQFPGKTTLEDLSKNAERYRKSKRSFAPAIRHVRRSHRVRSSKFSDHAMTFEPVFSHFGHSPLHSSIDHKVGPLIGPLNFPGMRKRVYIRLLVPPNEETSSRVTLHLVNNGPVETLRDIHDHGDFARFEKPKPSFPHKKPITLAQIPPSEAIINGEKNRFVEKPTSHFDFTPSNIRAFEFFEARHHPKFQPNVNHLQNELTDNQQQYLAAPNHHQLPIAFRPVENLINLPVYPPLSTAGESNIEKEPDNGGKVETLASGQKDMDTGVSDAQQSASSKHTWASPNLTRFSTAWSPSSVPGPRQPEAMMNRRESPASEFIEEVPAPVFRFSYSYSTPKNDATTTSTSSTSEGEHRSTTLSPSISTTASSPAPVKGKEKKVT